MSKEEKIKLAMSIQNAAQLLIQQSATEQDCQDCKIIAKIASRLSRRMIERVDKPGTLFERTV